MKKILNLYAGIGGNRKDWKGDIHVTAVELNPRIAEVYTHFHPEDRVVVGDAHQYLLDHYNEFDFIWSSPPCQSHSSLRQNLGVRYRGVRPKYPDMKLYQEIVFLTYNASCHWVVENVQPYYAYLIQPAFILQRHPFWANFTALPHEFEKDSLRSAQIPELQNKYGFDLSNFKIPDKRQILRNCVSPALGKYVFDTAMNIRTEVEQDLFAAQAV